MNKKRILQIVATTAVFTMMVLPMVAFGAIDTSAPVDDIDSGKSIGLGDVKTFIQDAATWLLGIAMTIAVIIIVVSGIMYMTAGDTDRAKTAKKWLWNGIWGALIVLAVGLILATIAGLVSGAENKNLIQKWSPRLGRLPTQSRLP